MPPSSDEPSPVDATTRLADAGGDTVLASGPQFPGAESYLPGDLIDGKYKVDRVHGGSGKSGMGVVYIANAGARTVAIKSIQRRFAKDLGVVERFLRESRSWMLLGFQPHVVHAYRIDIIDATPFLFLEYIAPDKEGAVSLADHLRGGALPIEEALRFGIHCAEGMRRATEALPNLVHRDLKPDNLLITRHGVLKITDFGLVRTALAVEAPLRADADAAENLTLLSGSALGTPAYMAPEQFESAESVGVAADIYAFGCCFYEALAGRRVFSVEDKSGFQAMLAYRDRHMRHSPTPLNDLVTNCPEPLNALIMRCLEKRPEHRWQSWIALHDELLAVYERFCGACYVGIESAEPSPVEVAAQVQSLTLLEGYRRAVQLRRLRERHDTSPYAFHLALASYFHCDGETDEAERQLERAAALRGEHDGYEAVGRLAEYWIEQGRLDDAESLLHGYLAEHPNGVERVLEAAVRLRVATGEHAAAVALLESHKQSWRGRSLLAEVLKAGGRVAEFKALLDCELSNTVETIRAFIADIEGGVEPAWARKGDPDTLCDVFDCLDAKTDTGVVAKAAHTYWPQLDGYPDFAGPMARLSWILGELAELEDVPATDRETFARLAKRLDHPRRLREYLERDERWLWEQERGEHAL